AERRCRALELAYHKARIAKPPTGVTWTTLGDAAVNHDRLRKPVTRAAREAGPYPYYGANGVQDHVSDFLFDGTYLLVGEDGSVVRADGTPVLNWAVGK